MIVSICMPVSCVSVLLQSVVVFELVEHIDIYIYMSCDEFLKSPAPLSLGSSVGEYEDGGGSARRRQAILSIWAISFLAGMSMVGYFGGGFQVSLSSSSSSYSSSGFSYF